MRRMLPSTVLSLIVIFIASFGDEIATMTFAFAQVDATSMAGISVLMASALLGGLGAGPLATFLLRRMRPHTVLALIFLLAGSTALGSAPVAQSPWVYVAAFLLGCLGTMFWSVLAVMIPQQCAEAELTTVNKIVHAVRNSGYIVGPMLAGVINVRCTVTTTLMVVSLIFFGALPFLHVVTRSRGRVVPTSDTTTSEVERLSSAAPISRLRAFFQLPRVLMTIIPLIVTICTTSTFNVAFIHLLLVERRWSEDMYGAVASALSLGLVVGPLALASRAEKYGVASMSCTSAAIIGLCLVGAGVSQAPLWLCIILFILGSANGVQNTLMSTFVMKVVPASQRVVMMPLYMAIVQASVLAGFLIGGVVPIHWARFLLMVAGGVAAIAGMLGAIWNVVADKTERCEPTSVIPGP